MIWLIEQYTYFMWLLSTTTDFEIWFEVVQVLELTYA